MKQVRSQHHRLNTTCGKLKAVYSISVCAENNHRLPLPKVLLYYMWSCMLPRRALYNIYRQMQNGRMISNKIKDACQHTANYFAGSAEKDSHTITTYIR